MSGQRSQSDLPEETLLIDDLIRYLSQLASLNGQRRTGNRELSVGLRRLARGLRPYSDRTISEFIDHIKAKTEHIHASSKPQKATLPPSLESVSQQDVERILGDSNYTKKQIIEIGIRRFGISRSKLEGSSKQDVVNSVFAALDHEKSLDVISQEASRSVRVS